MFRDNRLYLFGVAAILTVLAIAGVTLEINTEQRVRNIANLTEAQERKADLALYVRLLVDAETGQRGYLLTQDPSYLQPYERSRQQASVVLDRSEQQLSQRSFSAAGRQGSRGYAHSARTERRRRWMSWRARSS